MRESVKTLKRFLSRISKKIKIFKSGGIVALAIILPMDACKDIKCLNDGNCTAGKCTCDTGYAGETCQVNLCDPNNCQNEGICVVDVIDGISAPVCDCIGNFGGENCEFPSCGNDVPCYNDGTCSGQTCQCRWFHGESCHMPWPDSCYASPCQNSGTCISEFRKDENQVGF